MPNLLAIAIALLFIPLLAFASAWWWNDSGENRLWNATEVGFGVLIFLWGPMFLIAYFRSGGFN